MTDRAFEVRLLPVVESLELVVAARECGAVEEFKVNLKKAASLFSDLLDHLEVTDAQGGAV